MSTSKLSHCVFVMDILNIIGSQRFKNIMGNKYICLEMSHVRFLCQCKPLLMRSGNSISPRSILQITPQIGCLYPYFDGHSKTVIVVFEKHEI